MKARIVEDFYSIQGEGIQAGVPSLFIRLQGCNLRCDGFGQPDPADKSTYKDFKVELHKVPKYGCDTAYAVYPEFANDFKQYNSGCDYADYLLQQYPVEYTTNLVITGGEPLLKQQFIVEMLAELFKEKILKLAQLHDMNMDAINNIQSFDEFNYYTYDRPKEIVGNNNYTMRQLLFDAVTNITFETNGSVALNELKLLDCNAQDDREAAKFLQATGVDAKYMIAKGSTLFSISPKLNYVAGVDENISIRPEILCDLTIGDAMISAYQLKFVYDGSSRAIDKINQILKDIVACWKNIFKDNAHILSKEAMVTYDLKTSVLLMPVGADTGNDDVKKKTAEACLRCGFRYCPRLHVDIWGTRVGV